ncbi:hypothetical protein OIO90_004541 [Microbotryomycetes sp. JL221]|nr:hypothetical protein OIO90_004541 [Microbotryomycetes sp. JL221]
MSTSNADGTAVEPKTSPEAYTSAPSHEEALMHDARQQTMELPPQHTVVSAAPPQTEGLAVRAVDELNDVKPNDTTLQAQVEPPMSSQNTSKQSRSVLTLPVEVEKDLLRSNHVAHAQPDTNPAESGVDALATRMANTSIDTVAHAPQASPLPQPRPPPPPPQEEEWPLKQIAWPPLPPPPSDSFGQMTSMEPSVKIVCQNANGPCSLIALCNVLILRGDILITPQSRTSVTYSYLAGLIADHLLLTAPADASSASSFEAVLEILPSTRYGLNLNPRFGGIDGFKQSRLADGSTPGTGELDLFASSKVPLLHGWCVDPQDIETWDVVVENVGDYDAAVEKIVAGDEITAGEVFDEAEQDEAKLLELIDRRSKWTVDQEETVRQAHVIRRFLSSSRTQLTYHGLYLLSTMLAPSSLSALFRNSHLSVLYRRPATPTPHNTPHIGTEGPALFTLVTDATFVHESDVVWESLEDVEGALSDFYDGALRRTSVRGGAYVRSSAPRQSNEDPDVARMRRQEEERHLRRMRRDEAEQMEVEALSRQQVQSDTADGAEHDSDLALAQRIQAEEDERAWQVERDRRRRERAAEAAAAAESSPAVLAPGALSVGPTAVAQLAPTAGKHKKDKKKHDKDKCIIS